LTLKDPNPKTQSTGNLLKRWILTPSGLPRDARGGREGDPRWRQGAATAALAESRVRARKTIRSGEARRVNCGSPFNL
jgi:hypothetical protein